MKLQSKYNRLTITATVIVLLMGSIGYYFLLRGALRQPVDKALLVEEQEIQHFVQENNALPPESRFSDQEIDFNEAQIPVARKFLTTKVFDTVAKENEAVRQLVFPVRVGQRVYTATVTKSMEESEDLLVMIVSITTLVIVLLFTLLFFINRLAFKKLWSPFYATLAKMKKFNLAQPGKMSLEQSRINEFNDLNEALQQMTQKIKHDYESVKSFADNASHEMQTPLAVINSKLDLLIQDPSLNNKNMQQLQSIYDAVNKLTALHQSLLLLTKIENNQFTETSVVNMSELVKENLSHLEELMQNRELSVKTDFENCRVEMNSTLADILVNNLLSNTIRHSAPSATIHVATLPGEFHISNTATNGALDESTIFNRFKKNNASNGVGLGLAIVKQICETYKFRVSYQLMHGMHRFSVYFN
jgi:signal transduction histidine kinase